MQREKAKVIADKVVNSIQEFTLKVMIAGSIRRLKEEVGDIDLVVLLKPEFLVRENMLLKLRELGQITMSGQNIIRVLHKEGIELDVYISRPENFELLVLQRTGSKNHNIKLCKLAIARGGKLDFNRGLILDGLFISNMEEKILNTLLGFVPEPEQR